MTACNISGSANWQLGVEGESQTPPGGVVLLHSTRRALNEGARKAAHSLEPHQSPAAPQAVQSPWTTGLLCIVRFGASVVRIACSASASAGHSPCATRHWLHFSLAVDAQASRRDDGQLLRFSSIPHLHPSPPPFSLDSHRTQTTIASPIPPQQAASSRQKLTCSEAPPIPKVRTSRHIYFWIPSHLRASPKGLPPIFPGWKKNCVSCRPRGSHLHLHI